MRPYMWFIILNLPAIIAGWFWLFVAVSFVSSQVVGHFGGCSQSGFGLLCHSEALDALVNFWLHAMSALLIAAFLLVRHPPMLWLLIPTIILFTGTTTLLLAGLKRLFGCLGRR